MLISVKIDNCCKQREQCQGHSGAPSVGQQEQSILLYSSSLTCLPLSLILGPHTCQGEIPYNPPSLLLSALCF